MFKNIMTIIIAVALIGGIGYLAITRNPRADQILIDQTQRTVVNLLQSTLKLETAEMNVTKPLEGTQQLNDFLAWYRWTNAIQNFLFGDKISMIAEWTLKAWFDLKKISSGAIRVNDDLTVSIMLPAPEILSTSVNTKTLDRNLWVLTKGNIELETLVREQATKIFVQEAVSGGFLETAKKNAQTEVESLFKGVVTIREITFDNDK